MAMPQIKIGCDPEAFLRRKADNQMVSAWGLIPGDKKAPHKVPGGAIQVDGMAVEFNIDPADNIQQWRERIAQVRGELDKAIPEGLEVVIQASATFEQAYFDHLDPDSKILGCDPDFNAYTRAENPRPDGNPPQRGAGGHIHIGWTEGKGLDDPDHIEDCIEVVKQLDFSIGLMSTLWDRDTVRRQYYGRAGAYRVKPYGVEYRTPSNMWLSKPYITDYVYNAAMASVADLFDGNVYRMKGYPNWPAHHIDNLGKTQDLDSGNFSWLIRNSNRWMNIVPLNDLLNEYKMAQAAEQAKRREAKLRSQAAAVEAAAELERREMQAIRRAPAPVGFDMEVRGLQPIRRGELNPAFVRIDAGAQPMPRPVRNMWALDDED